MAGPILPSVLLPCIASGAAALQSSPPEIRTGETVEGEVTEDDAEIQTDALIGRGDLEEPVRGVSVLWKVERAGTCTLDLESYFFDAYLVVRDGSGAVVAEDDDGGLRLHARIVLEGLEPGVLRLEAAALHGECGPFRLSLRDGRPAELTEAERLAAELEDARYAVEVCEEVRGPDDPSTATSLNNLAFLLQNLGRYDEAQPLFERALAVREATLGPADPATALVLNNLSSLLLAQGRYEDALPLQERALALREAALGPEDHEVAESLNNLGVLLQCLDRLDQARPLYERALAIQEATLGPDHLLVATTLENLASVLPLPGEFERARAMLERALALRKAALGPQHPTVAQSLIGLALLLHGQGRREEARPLYEQALEIYENALGPDHPSTALALSSLGLLLRDAGEFEEARPVLERALALREKSLGPDHPDTALSLQNLGALAVDQGRYEAAGSLYERAIAIEEKTLGPHHSTTASSLNNLAQLLMVQGRYEAARPVYERALEAWKGGLGPEDPDVAITLSNLALLFRAQGLHEQARPLLEEALALQERTLGQDDPRTAVTVSNLGQMLRDAGRHEEARRAFERALAVFEESLGPDSQRVATSLSNLAMVLQAEGRPGDAEPLFERAVAISERSVGPGHPEVATTLTNLALLLLHQRRHDEARPLLERALAIREDALGPHHPLTARSLTNLAGLEEAQEHPEAAMDLYRRSLAVRRSVLVRQLPVLAERERFVWSGEHRDALDQVLRLGASHPGLLDAESCYAEVLAFKGIVSRGVLADRRWHQERTDPEVLALENRLGRVLAELSRSFLEVESTRPVEALRQEREALERQLAACRGFQESTRLLAPAEVRDALADDEALVDFLFYEGDGEECLAAFVVRPGHAVERVELGADGAIGTGRSDPGSTAADLRELADLRGGVVVAGENQDWTVPEALWAPLRPLLDGAQRVFLCPDGALATLPFEVFPGQEPGTYLIEEHSFVYLETPELLVRRDPEVPTAHGILLAGGIDYDADPRREESRATTASPPAGGALSSRGADDGLELRGLDLRWSPLEETGPEVQDLSSFFARTHPGEPCSLLLGAGASERSVKDAVAGHRYLHLATHGYFAPAQAPSKLEKARALAEAESVVSGDEPRARLAGWYPGLLSGVVLAGANHLSSGAGEDGILTAEEVLWLDLQGCELVTLSACETGLGTARAGEQLLGLRRAFHLAGARSTVTSLWKVDDAATRELMREFYERLWVKGESKSDALRNSQLSLLRKNRARHGEALPGTWGAFVLEGDWR